MADKVPMLSHLLQQYINDKINKSYSSLNNPGNWV